MFEAEENHKVYVDKQGDSLAFTDATTRVSHSVCYPTMISTWRMELEANHIPRRIISHISRPILEQLKTRASLDPDSYVRSRASYTSIANKNTAFVFLSTGGFPFIDELRLHRIVGLPRTTRAGATLINHHLPSSVRCSRSHPPSPRPISMSPTTNVMSRSIPLP